MKRLGMVYQYSYMEQWQPKDIPVTFRMYQMNFDKSLKFVYKNIGIIRKNILLKRVYKIA